MQEFSSVTASSYDAESLAPMLSEKSQEGWSIVSIVAAGTNIVAYLSRDTDTPAAQPAAGAATTATEPSAADPADAPTQAFTPAASAVEEPAGWGAVDEGPAAMENADADTSTDDAETDLGTAVTGAAALTDLSTDDATKDASDTPAAVEEDTTVNTEPEAATEPDAPAEQAPAEEAQPAEPPADAGVPAGWYADPSGRYELRYWDGAAWTEHVSRAGQQYTDPPVA